MPGIQDFTRFDVGKETVRGTPVAPTRKLYGEGTGVLEPDFGLKFHEEENTGRRLRIRRATSTLEDVALKYRSASGVSYDELVVPFACLKGGATGVGGGADKTWTMAPSLTAANNPDSFSIDVGDDVQNWRCQYAMATRIKLAAEVGGLTSIEHDWFAQRAVKGAAAAPAGNLAVKIPGDIWTIKFAATFAGLGAAAISTNFLLGWELEISTGLIADHTQDGNLYFGQHVETHYAATLTLTVESTALAISELYDKAAAATMDFVRLKATGPALGASNYSAQFDMPLLYQVPKVISEERDGINVYEVTANVADDGTNGLAPTFVNSLAALP